MSLDIEQLACMPKAIAALSVKAKVVHANTLHYVFMRREASSRKCLLRRFPDVMAAGVAAALNLGHATSFCRGLFLQRPVFKGDR